MKYLLSLLLFPVIASAQQKIRITAIGTNSISTDTNHLSERIDARVKYTDTALMLNPYLRKLDTTSKWVGSVYKRNDTFFYKTGTTEYFAGKDSSNGITPETVVGQIHNQSTFSSLTGLLDSGSVSPTFSGGEMILASGSSTYTKTISLNTGNYAKTALPHWRATVKIKPTGTSTGAFVGLRSINTWFPYDGYGKIVLDGGANNGQLQIIGNAHTSLATSSGNLSYSTNDLIVLTYERDWNVITFTARNQTTNSAVVSATYTYNVASSSNPTMPNTGRFSFGSLSATPNLNVDSFAVSSITNKNAQIMIVGDSKSSGYCASAFTTSWSYLISQYFRSTVFEAQGADRTSEVVTRISEITTLHPQNVLLNIGRNDIQFGTGIDSNTTKSNYAAIVSAMQGAGITVWHLLPIYDAIVDETWLVNYINRTYPADHIIDTWTATHFAGLLNADNVHPNDTGHGIIYRTILYSFYFQTIIPYNHYH